MRSIKIIIPAIITAITWMQACSSKDFDHCDETLVPKATVDSQVVAGDTINLSVTGITNVYMYNWYGPNEFSSHEQTPIIEHVSGASAGRYTVDVITNDGCIYTVTTDSVKVKSVQPPCTLVNNYAEFSNTFDVSFYNVGGATSGGSYFVTANASRGYFKMEFLGANRPFTGVYNIQPFSGSWNPSNVRIDITNQGAIWSSGSGKVYVNAVNGKLVVSFCNVDFTYQGYKTKINCQVTVP
jgi:hypothetical protein